MENKILYAQSDCGFTKLPKQLLDLHKVKLIPEGKYVRVEYEDEELLDKLLSIVYTDDDEEGSFVGTCKYFGILCDKQKF